MSNSSMVNKRINIPTSNYTKGRTVKIWGIVIHHACATNITSVDNTFNNPNRHGSAHYCVQGNQVHQYVDEADTAWHCSNWDGNCGTVGIETINSSLGGDYPVADDTFNTLCKLVADIAKRNGLGRITFSPDGYCPSLSAHRDWAATDCPGNYLYRKMKEIEQRANDINYPPAPTYSWKDITTKSIVAVGSGKLVALPGGSIIKEYADGTKIDNIVQECTYKDSKYYRTQYSKDKKIDNGLLAVTFKDYVEPKPEPEPTPEPEPKPEPTPEPEPEDDTPNWFIRFIQALGEFFTNLFKKEK